MPVTSDRAAPYAPASAVVSLIERHRQKGLPTPINGDVLARAGVSDSLIPRTLQALVALDLITEDGKPTDVLDGLRLAAESDYKLRFTEWLQSAYADALSFVDPAVDDEIKIRDAFRSYSPIGQQARMVTLFTGLFEASGTRQAKPRAMPKKAEQSSRPPKRAAGRTKTPPAKQRDERKLGNTEGAVPPAIAGLLASLPPSGDSWTKEERDRFVTTFSAVLDFCFPVEKRQERKIEQENDDGGDS